MFAALFVSPPSKHDSKFGVRHYAGLVTYTSAGFIVKNKDSRRDGWLEFVRGTTSPILLAANEAGLRNGVGVSSDGNDDPPTTFGDRRHMKKSSPTVVSKYRASLRQVGRIAIQQQDRGQPPSDYSYPFPS